MDLRSIINADSSTAPPPAHPPPPSQFHPPQQQPQAPLPADYSRSNQGPHVSPSSASSYQGFQGNPTQPPPLQPPSQTDFRSPSGSSYHSAQSPYQHTPTSSLSGGQHSFPQSQQHPPPQSPVGQGQYPPSYPQRDSYSATTVSGQSLHHFYPHPSPSPYTPSATTPGSSHLPQHQRSHSSYSTPTPTSAQIPTPYARRESPVLAGSHTFPQPQTQQQHQPSTPLGPPLPHTRTPSGNQREQHSPYSHQRNQSGGSYGAPSQNQPGSPTAQMPQGMARTVGTSIGYGLAQSPLSDQERGGREYVAARERERSVSVSPKTMLPSQPRPDDAESKYADYTRFNRQVTPAKRKVEDAVFERNGRIVEQTIHSTSPNAVTLDRRDHGSPSSVGEITMNGRNGLQLADNHSAPAGSGVGGWRDPGSGHAQEQLRSDAVLPSPTTQTNTKELNPSDSRGPHSSSGCSSTVSHQSPPNQQPTTPQAASSRQTPNSQPSPKGLAPQPPVSSFPPPPPPPPPPPNLTATTREPHTMSTTPRSASSPKQPQRKRLRYEETPIFARKASRSTGNSPVMVNRRQPALVQGLTSGVTAKQEPRDSKRLIASQPISQSPDFSSTKREPPNGHPHPVTNNIAHTSQPPEYRLWEPTITNVFPYEEITRTISHFLFEQVVLRDDVGARPVGSAPRQSAQLEIEAKIGQLIDRNTGERLRLPVMNECIIMKDDPSMRISFKSSMTESQHKTLNNFLNKAVMDSSQAPKDPSQQKRIPMTYVHTHERDSFYELPPHAHNILPQSIRAQINPRHKIKVRVTTDQRNGKTLAKIIKARVADLDVHSPQTPFDWRLSVNLEMEYEGEIEGLVGGDDGNRADRNKDRMSYRHLAYQIDLTQVTPSDSTSKADKEHELEVEVSTAEILKQGHLAREMGCSFYEELVKGLVNNVRVLVRAAHAQ